MSEEWIEWTCLECGHKWREELGPDTPEFAVVVCPRCGK